MGEAVLQCSRGELDAAVHACAEADAIDPENPRVKFILCGLHREQKQHQLAREALEASHAKGFVPATRELGKMYADEGDTLTAKMLWEQAHRKGCAEATYLLAGWYDKQGSVDKAQHLWWLAHSKGIVLATHALGSVYRDQRRLNEAIDMFESAHLRGCQKATIDLAGLMSAMSVAYPEISCDAESMLLPLQQMGNAGAAAVLAGVYRMKHKYQEAEASAREAVSMGDVSATFLLGLLLFEQGRCSEAQQYLETAFIEADTRIDGRQKATLVSMLSSLLVPMANFHWPRTDGSFAQPVDDGDEGHVQEDGLSQPRGNLSGLELTHMEADRAFNRGINGGAISGDFVQVSGLQSQEGRGLNNQIGVVLMHDSATDRQRILLPHVGIKKIRMCNLQVCHRSLHQVASALEKLRAPPSCTIAPKAESMGNIDFVEQAAIDASLKDAACDTRTPDASSVNAQISQALLSSSKAPHVCLLTYSRSPKSFRDVLMKGPDLSACRSALESQGFLVELQSGTKIFVEPDVYPAVMEAIQLGDFKLAREHVIVSPQLESTVRKLVDDLPKKDKVYARGPHSKVPLGLADIASLGESMVLVSRTFIHIKVPNSMCSSTAEGPLTASTTDADGRKPRNHRGKGSSGK